MGQRFIYGDSYGDVGNRELATDAARDSRYFNSLSSNRADQAQADQEGEQADSSNLRWAALQDQSAARDAVANQFQQNLALHRGGLALDQAKFAHEVAQPTPAEIRDKERRDELKLASDNADFQDANAFHLSGSIAKAGNELNQVNDQILNLQTQKAALDKRLTGPNLPTWLGGGGTEDTLRGQFATDALGRPLTSMSPEDLDLHYNHALQLLQTRQARLKSYIDGATAKGSNLDLYNLDEHGNYTPTFQPRNPNNRFITRTTSMQTPPAASVPPAVAPAPPDVPLWQRAARFAGTLLAPQTALIPAAQEAYSRWNAPSPVPGPDLSTTPVPDLSAYEGKIVKSNGQLWLIKDGQPTPVQ